MTVYKRERLKNVNNEYIVTPSMADMVYYPDGKTVEQKYSELNNRTEILNNGKSNTVLQCSNEGNLEWNSLKAVECIDFIDGEDYQLEQDDVLDQLSNLDEKVQTKVDKLDSKKHIDVTRLYRSIDSIQGGKGSFLQGATKTTENKAVYAIYDFKTPETNIVELIEVNYTTGQKIRSKVLELGHANSMTYNKKTNELVIANLKKFVNGIETYVSELIVVDYSNLSIKKTVSLGSQYTVSGVAYDEVKDKYMVLIDPFKVAQCNTSDFGIESEVVLNVPERIKTFIRQSLEVWNGYIFLCGYSHNYISVFDYQGNNIQNYYVPDYIDHMYITGELEDISALGNGEFLMFSTQNVGSKYLVNMVSKFSVTNQVASGTPYGFTNAGGPKKIYVDINSTSSNPDGTQERPFKQLNEALLAVNNPLFSNVEINVANGTYDWCYLGEISGKVNIIGKDVDKTILKGIFINSGNVSISKIRFDQSENDSYKGLISCYGARLNANNVKLNTKDYGIYANNGSYVVCKDIGELNSSESIHTLYGINSSYFQIQKSASNVIKAFVDNTSQLLPHLLIYNNTGNEYLADIPIPSWFEKTISNNSLKYLDILCGVKVTENTPTYNTVRILTSSYNSFVLNLQRVSGNKTFISTINFSLVERNGIKYMSPSSAYVTTIDFSGSQPSMTTKNMVGNELGSIYIGRIIATN